MGVEYRNLLLPRDRGFVPEFSALAALVERLRVERWVLTPDSDGWVESDRPSETTGGRAEVFVPSARPRERSDKALAIPLPLDAEWLEARRDRASSNPQADELSLCFMVSSGDEPWADIAMPYPFAYGEDEAGYHDILVHAARDYVVYSGSHEVLCACGAALGYETARGDLAPIDIRERVRSTCVACGSNVLATGIEREASRFAVIVDCQKGWPVARRVGEPAGIVRALEGLGYHVTNPPAERARAPEDTPSSPEFDGSVMRSGYGDPAPPIHHAFLLMVEETFGVRFDSVPEFY